MQWFKVANCVRSMVSQFQFGWSFLILEIVYSLGEELELPKSNMMPALRRSGRTPRTCHICSFALGKNIVISSRYTRSNWHLIGIVLHLWVTETFQRLA